MNYLIIGLGNIGTQYEDTRHNIGFMVADRLAQKWSADFKPQKLAMVAEGKYRGKNCYIIKPTTYMNLSGKAVSYYMSQYKIPVERILVIVDDLALPFASVRLRGKGSSAGHNGLGDIEQKLNSSKYARLRIGIGDNYPRGRQADFVLSPFTREEFEKVPELCDFCSDAIESYIFRGLQQTMTAFNRK
jgi:PTH1 family peptidyl-tRNA hydrolase